MAERVWVLGASDPEMVLIENLLREVGEEYIYALDAEGARVHPGNAYRCPIPGIPGIPEGVRVYVVECIDTLPEGWERVDHHRPGDPGYGRPPSEFLEASSIGQVLSELAGVGRLPATWYKCDWAPGVYYHAPTFAWSAHSAAHAAHERWIVGERVVIPPEYVLCAAADHCLGAAYSGECPGVGPDELMRWRVDTRAAHQGRPAEDVLDDVGAARAALRAAPRIDLGSGVEVCDMQGELVPELPEAAAREGAAYLATVTERDGRRKVVLGGHTTPETVRAFMSAWAPAHGLTGVYGDPARGFAGGYMPE